VSLHVKKKDAPNVTEVKS